MRLRISPPRGATCTAPRGRPKIAGLLPRQGVPPALGDVDGFVPHAERLGCASALLDASRLLATDGAAGVHREIAVRHGLPGLVMALSGRFAAAGA